MVTLQSHVGVWFECFKDDTVDKINFSSNIYSKIAFIVFVFRNPKFIHKPALNFFTSYGGPDIGLIDSPKPPKRANLYKGVYVETFFPYFFVRHGGPYTNYVERQKVF